MKNSIVNISFIGYGNLAKALAKSLLGNPSYRLRAAAPSLQRGLSAEGALTTPCNKAVLAEADLLILAVKPNRMKAVLLEIKDELSPDCVLISVAAGLSLAWLAQYSPPQQAIVRAMPNIATAVKKGATPLIANQYLGEAKLQVITALFKCSGCVSWLAQEEDIDIFTALSGSGPAYVFLFLEAMADASEKLGLSKELAQSFALQTMEGAVHLAKESKVDFAELRKKVTSPRGTTAAAIELLQAQGLPKQIFEAMEAAHRRAREISEENKI